MKKAESYILPIVTVIFVFSLFALFAARNYHLLFSESNRDTSSSEIRQSNHWIDLNTATIEELILLPGIGEKTAQRIIEYRAANGPFSSIYDLIEIDGISVDRLEEIRDYITVGG